MNELLMNLKDRLNSISIIGLNSINDDFRLKKIYEKIKALSSKAPVLAKLSSMIESLMSSDNKNAEDDLCGIINLVNAVLYTQGVSSSNEKEEAIQVNISRRKDLLKLTSRELGEIRDILNGGTTTKWASLKKAYQEKKLIDYRLLQDFMNNIGDAYVYEDNFSIVTILSEYGQEIVPLLLNRFQTADGKEKANIVKVISNIGRENFNDYYKKWIEEEENENVLACAIKSLRYSQENNDYLLKLKLKKKKLKEARIYALAYMNTEEAHNEVKKLTLKDADLLNDIFNEVEFLSSEEIITLLKLLMSELNEEIDYKKGKVFLKLIQCAGTYKTDEIKNVFKDIIESRIEEKLDTRYAAVELYRQHDEECFKYLLSLKDKFDRYYIKMSFAAALNICSKEEIFDDFSNLSTEEDKVLALIEEIRDYHENDYRYSYYNFRTYIEFPIYGANDIRIDIKNIEEWDERWIKYSLNGKWSKISSYFIGKNQDLELSAELRSYYLDQLATFSRKSNKDDYVENAIIGLIKIGCFRDLVNNEDYAYEFTRCMNRFKTLFINYLTVDDIEKLKELSSQLENKKQRYYYSKSYVEEMIIEYIDEINKKNKQGL